MWLSKVCTTSAGLHVSRKVFFESYHCWLKRKLATMSWTSLICKWKELWRQTIWRPMSEPYVFACHRCNDKDISSSHSQIFFGEWIQLWTTHPKLVHTPKLSDQFIKMASLQPVICHCLVTETIDHNSKWDVCLPWGEPHDESSNLFQRAYISLQEKNLLCGRKVTEWRCN